MPTPTLPTTATIEKEWIINSFSSDEFLLTKDKSNNWFAKKGLTTKALSDLSLQELLSIMQQTLVSKQLSIVYVKQFTDMCVALKTSKELTNSKPAVILPTVNVPVRQVPSTPPINPSLPPPFNMS